MCFTALGLNFCVPSSQLKNILIILLNSYLISIEFNEYSGLPLVVTGKSPNSNGQLIVKPQDLYLLGMVHFIINRFSG